MNAPYKNRWKATGSDGETFRRVSSKVYSHAVVTRYGNGISGKAKFCGTFQHAQKALLAQQALQRAQVKKCNLALRAGQRPLYPLTFWASATNEIVTVERDLEP